MPLLLRKSLTVLSFGMFFASGILLGILVFPTMRLLTWTRERHVRFCTWALTKSYPIFLFWLRFANLVSFEPPKLPDDLPRDRPYVLIANHPSHIDVIICMGFLRGLTSMVKASWFRWWVMRSLLRTTQYIPGPGLPGDEANPEAPIDRMVEQLRKGHPLVVFPEGTRSPSDGLLSFHRGPFDAAVRAGEPLVPLFIAVDNPGLNRENPLMVEKMTYTFDWLPWIDCAEAGSDPRKLKQRTWRAYRERLDRYVRERDLDRAANEETNEPHPSAAQ